jgi:nucleoside-diphosphate-sugar epimerase
MRVAVTGASGFVGRATIAPLLALGAEVHLLGRVGHAVAGCHSHAIDLLADDPAPLLARIAPTHLLHLAWYAEPGKFWHAAQNLDWLAASLRLARGFAAAGGTRLVGTGSCAEYDWREPLLDEATTLLAPSTLYGTAKAALFKTLTAAAPVLGLSLGWGRIFFPFGRGERAGRLLPDVIDAVRAGRRVATSDGTQRRDFIHVDDAGAAMVALLASEVTGAVNIASGDCRPLRDIIGMAATLAGDAALIDWGARPRQPGEPQVMAAATARLYCDLGFRPRWSLADGLADMVASRRLP